MEDVWLALPEDPLALTIHIGIDNVEHRIVVITTNEKADDSNDDDSDIGQTDATHHWDANLSVCVELTSAGYAFHESNIMKLSKSLNLYLPKDRNYYNGAVKNMHKHGFVTALYDENCKECRYGQCTWPHARKTVNSNSYNLADQPTAEKRAGWTAKTFLSILNQGLFGNLAQAFEKYPLLQWVYKK